MASTQMDLYSASIGLYIHCFESLIAILTQGSESPIADTLPSAKLAEDMFDLATQVKIAISTCCKAALRIADVDLGESWADEKTLPELITRTQTMLDRLKAIPPEKVAGRDAALVTLQLGPLPAMQLSVVGYALGYAAPNLFFHLNAAYAILRMKGLPLGKGVYLTPFLTPYKEPSKE